MEEELRQKSDGVTKENTKRKFEDVHRAEKCASMGKAQQKAKDALKAKRQRQRTPIGDVCAESEEEASPAAPGAAALEGGGEANGAASEPSGAPAS